MLYGVFTGLVGFRNNDAVGEVLRCGLQRPKGIEQLQAFACHWDTWTTSLPPGSDLSSIGQDIDRR